MAGEKELDLPYGVPAHAAGASVGAFRASGQADVGNFLSPKPTPPLPTAAPVVSAEAGWAERARVGLLGMFGLLPAPATTTVSPTSPTRTADLEKELDDLERRSTVASPVYQARLSAYATK